MELLQIVGIGSLGEALATGILESGYRRPDQLVLVHRNPVRAVRLSQRFPGVHLSTDLQRRLDTIVSVRPEDVEDVCLELDRIGVQRIISLAAGVGLDRLEAAFGSEVAVFRAMPNVAVSYCLGQTAIAGGKAVAQADIEYVRELFGQVGEVMVIEESMFDVFTAFCGCAPGFTIKFVSALVNAAIEMGFSPDDAQRLAVSSLAGNSRWLLDHSSTMDEELGLMIDLDGPTSALVKALEADQFDRTIYNAMRAAVDRSSKMSQAIRNR